MAEGIPTGRPGLLEYVRSMASSPSGLMPMIGVKAGFSFHVWMLRNGESMLGAVCGICGLPRHV